MRRQNMLGRIVIIIALLISVTAAVVFIYRYQIAQYSAEAFLRSALPEYVKVDTIRFEFTNNRIVLNGFKIINPPDFSYRYLLEIEEITCNYRMRGKTVLDGFEILEPVFKKALLNIERLGDNRLNLLEMRKVVEKSEARKKEKAIAAKSEAVKKGVKEGEKGAKRFLNLQLSDVVKLPEDYRLKEGKIMLMDRFNLTKPHMITFENIEAALSMRLDEKYQKVLSLASTGEGNMNGKRGEVAKWTISLNPTTPSLTMSNRFEVSGVDIKSFEPYYDKYSPFVFKKGTFSGTLVFDFDNGNIGSMNEVRLSHFQFYVKQGYENAQVFDTNVEDLVKYFTSPYGEIIFDFKIKGPMSKPKFYLGPKAKQAMTSMTIDKITGVIGQISGQPSGQPSGQQPPQGTPKSDIDKAKEYIDLFREIVKKK